MPQIKGKEFDPNSMYPIMVRHSAKLKITRLAKKEMMSEAELIEVLLESYLDN